ncbi:hypothetical protein FRC04_011440 [Tulasnella sp. 424]|nr:hypothetical protein FRC04_011440 [Tulasnella sp. 424]KAG8971962.1 hypothetical protein FRC05_010497 [Tulasnella sp. 425]
MRSNINSLLPPELLALAFSFVMFDAREEISFGFLGKPDAEQLRRQFSQSPLLNASLVCRAWYSVIRDTARFWTFVGIDLKRSSATASKKSKPVLSPRSITQSKKAEILLEKSGRLPFSVAICPDHIEDLESINKAIRKHVERLETLYLIPSDEKASIKSGRSKPPQTPPSQAFKLFFQPLPNLKRLSVDRCLAHIMYGIAGRPLTLQQAVDAPRLESIFCHTHLITPKSPARLASLSLASVQLDHPPQPSMEFPHLVDLRMQDCDPGAILSTFSTPSLKRLIVCNWKKYDAPAQLPRYDSLHELQWLNMGQDPAFVMLCQRCPNLKRYSNYIKGNEEGAVLHSPQSVLGVVDDGMARGVDTSSMWPMLEEVLLGRASCDEVAMLLTAVPSIKRVRVLYPVKRDDEDDHEQEMEKLAMLRHKVDVAIRREPWKDGGEKVDPDG